MRAEALVELCEHQWYDAAESTMRRMAAAGDRSQALAEAIELTSLAHRVMSLDAEDFTQLVSRHQRPWAKQLRQCAFPVQPKDPQRGALGSLVPLYQLMLEVVQLRHERGEPQSLVVAAHLIGEYLCQLAFEPRLGHAGDPLLLRRDVGQRWGTDDPDCSHNSAMRATAKRAINVSQGDQTSYTRYLDKFHSRLGDTLAVCAMNHQTTEAGDRPDVGQTCSTPCRWVLAGSLEQRKDLDARSRLALIYLNSPLVALRHHAPVGHFFGVPSAKEIQNSWRESWQKLTTQWKDGMNPLVAATDRGRPSAPAGEALPGLQLLVSTVAAQPVAPSRVLRDIGEDAIAAIRRWEDAAPQP